MIFLCDFQCLFTGGSIRIGRAACDHIQRIPKDIAQNNTEHLRRSTGLCETAALYIAQAFADGIHLHNVRTAGQQLLRNILELFPGNLRLLKQRTSSAGEQEKNRILFRQSRNQFQSLRCSRKAILIRNRMSCFEADNAGNLSHHMVIFCDNNSFIHRAECFYRCGCHLPGRFSGGYQHRTPAFPRLKIRQCPGNRFIRQNCMQAGLNNLIRIFSQVLSHINLHSAAGRRHKQPHIINGKSG